MAWEMSKTRLEAFSDGVIAIIITILVLELEMPEIHEGDGGSGLLHALPELMPQLIAYMVSFLVVAIFWVNHHSFFHRLETTNHTLIWLNVHFLFWISLIPFPTGYMGEHPFSIAANIMLAAVFLMGSLAFKIMSSYSMFRSDICEDSLLIAEKKRIARIEWIGPILYGLAVLAAFVDTRISIGMLVVTPLVYFIPAREKKRIKSDRDELTTKEYANGEVKVIWKPHKCVHSGKCFNGLPEVFNPKVRPWVNVDGASSKDTIDQVQQCPSGALTFEKMDAEKV
ncbi:MAG: DUF1211 domain-containing protein [Bacteroidetes bacterium]|nr:DUF1211 domain-containing protein [Bacteroidota bacterium]